MNRIRLPLLTSEFSLEFLSRFSKPAATWSIFFSHACPQAHLLSKTCIHSLFFFPAACMHRIKHSLSYWPTSTCQSYTQFVFLSNMCVNYCKMSGGRWTLFTVFVLSVTDVQRGPRRLSARRAKSHPHPDLTRSSTNSQKQQGHKNGCGRLRPQCKSAVLKVGTTSLAQVT